MRKKQLSRGAVVDDCDGIEKLSFIEHTIYSSLSENNNNNNNNSDDVNISDRDSDDMTGCDINDPHQELFIVSDADDLDDEVFYAKYRQRLKELKARIATETAKENKQ